MIDWLIDAVEVLVRFLLHPVTFFVGVVIVIVLVIKAQGRSIDRECASMMTLARTTRDTLDVRIACGKLRSDQNTANAIGFGAGAVAGSAAGRK